ncbi:peptide chain release factor N(5)-glutamine methyltransferase [Alicyclobacillus shizuokensis]|uniref:peptide chain release factor N(5)-glutamine methyltransferase n=1 Tax=Alicyclobacillus shizuokensis TaxID=392014 RepID=UPI0008365049|nr:peptide chain release factor N(5)-glutamine methyltransferase [Alicyclobacillus shizuokensis]MCL6627341.1 peptide chain release factor N(5)-glutamine methyltransferase [Alicyclobacillus shizuokensis]
MTDCPAGPMNGAQPATVQEALAWASFCLARAFPGKHADAAEAAAVARCEAEQLLLAAAGWSRTELLVRLRDRLPEGVWGRFADTVAQRQSGRPLQYILGEAWFYGRSFAVEPGCLIPRPETEVLVACAIRWLRRHPGARVLDIGAGSGAIAITLALECPQVEVHGVDISEAALRICRMNAHRLGARVQWHHADAPAFLRAQTGRWNAIASNPPYVPTLEVDQLDEEVRRYEPRLALDGGRDGLDFYRRLAKDARIAFAPGPAALWLEVGSGQAGAVIDLFQRDEGRLWTGWRFDAVPDLRNILRVVVGERGGEAASSISPR